MVLPSIARKISQHELRMMKSDGHKTLQSLYMSVTDDVFLSRIFVVLPCRRTLAVSQTAVRGHDNALVDQIDITPVFPLCTLTVNQSGS